MDFVKFGSNQRVDADDLSYGMSTTQLNAVRAVTANILSTQGQWVVNGFTTSNTSGTKTLVIASGTAILSMRTGAVVVNGMVIAPADASGSTSIQASQSIDLSNFATGTYRVYIRFNLTDANYQSRTFWGQANGGSEYAQSVPTRQQAVWEVRVEANNPGAEWLCIAEVVLSSTAITSVTDKRPLFFEGSGSAPAYANTWGSTNDRSADRSTYAVGDLKTFIDAVKTCLEDIKGPGAARWYSPYILGMNIGDGFTSQNVTTNRICLGDTGCYIDNNVQADGNKWPTLFFDNTNAYLRCFRNATTGAASLSMNATGGVTFSAGTSVGISANSGNVTITANDAGYYVNLRSRHSGGKIFIASQIAQSTPPAAIGAIYAYAANNAWLEIGGGNGTNIYGRVGQMTTTGVFGMSYGFNAPFISYDANSGSITLAPSSGQYVYAPQVQVSQTWPTPASPPDLRTLNASNMVVAWGYIGAGATGAGPGYNVASVSRPNTGRIRVGFQRAVSSYVAMIINTNDNTRTFISTENLTSSYFDVLMTDTASGSATNRNFTFICIGQPV